MHGQIIATTHSPIALVEFSAEDLIVVRAKAGEVECLQVSRDLQSVIRRVPEGLLSRNIIICEGQTEFGFLMAFEQFKISQGGQNFSYLGTSLVDGHGSTFLNTTIGLSRLKYNTCIFVDSDDDGIKSNISALKEEGVTVFTWSGKKSIEQEIANDLPEELLYSFIELAIQIDLNEGIDDAEARILNQLNSKLSSKYKSVAELKASSLHTD